MVGVNYLDRRVQFALLSRPLLGAAAINMNGLHVLKISHTNSPFAATPVIEVAATVCLASEKRPPSPVCDGRVNMNEVVRQIT